MEDGSEDSDESEEKEESEESEESEDREYSEESEESEEEEAETMMAEKYFTATAFNNYRHEWLVGFYNYLSHPPAGHKKKYV